MIPMAKPLIGEEEKRAVSEVLESGMLAQGKKVREFELSFADFLGVKHAIAISNGTTALHAALLAHNLGPGDEVITTPFSFVATANAIRMTGAKPVFVDIEEGSFNLNPQLIESAITPWTKAIMPVHLFGLPARMDLIQEIAQKHNLLVIEDACQAHGAEFQGRKVGSFGTGCFSFYPTKNMTTGEGGMITTDNEEVAQKIRKIINHGSEKKYYHDFLGYNYRMTDLAAALGIEQLRKLPAFTQSRKFNAAILNELLARIPGIIIPQDLPGHVFHQYTIRVQPGFGISREGLASFLAQEGIDTAVFYPLSIHQQKSDPGHNHLSFPVAEKASQEVLSLPIHPALSREDLQKISEAIKKAAEGRK